MIQRHEITGLVLAGGRATRMGGVDKGLLPFLGEPLALHAARRLAPQVGSLAINANRELTLYRAWGLPVWPDASDDRPGPLAGILAGLRSCSTPWLAVVPCDSPRFPADLVDRLAGNLASDASLEAAVAATASSDVLELQPVFCLLRRSLVDPLDAFLQEGGRKVERWLRGRRHVAVPFEDLAAFANVNTPDELQALERAAG